MKCSIYNKVVLFFVLDTLYEMPVVIGYDNREPDLEYVMVRTRRMTK